MEHPKISVVTVVFNDHLHIEQTLCSVLNQTYDNIEYIVIDGGSTDGTVQIIKKYANKLAYWVSEPDKGIYDAMNKAIDMCTGDWVVFINSWDAFHDNDVLTNVFSRYISEDVDVIYGDVCMVTGYGRLIKRFDKLDESIMAFNLCHQSTFTRTSLLKKYKYDTTYRIAADMDFFNKVKIIENAKFLYIPIVMANYECGNGTSANSIWKKSKEYRRLRKINKWSIESLKIFTKDLLRLVYYSLPFGIAQKAAKKRMLSLYKIEENHG